MKVLQTECDPKAFIVIVKDHREAQKVHKMKTLKYKGKPLVVRYVVRVFKTDGYFSFFVYVM